MCLTMARPRPCRPARGTPFVHPIKPLKHAFQRFGGDAGTVVLNRHLDPPLLHCATSDGHRTAVSTILNRVVQKVGEHLLQPIRIGLRVKSDNALTSLIFLAPARSLKLEKTSSTIGRSETG